jgi:hypothetical protein
MRANKLIVGFVLPLTLASSACSESQLNEPFNGSVARRNGDPVPTGSQSGCFRLQADDIHFDAVWDETECSNLNEFTGQTFSSSLLRDSLWSIPYGDNTHTLGSTRQLVYFVRAQYYFANANGVYDASLSRSEVVGAVFPSFTACGNASSCPRGFAAINFSSELPVAAVAVEFVGFPGLCPITFTNDPIGCAKAVENGSEIDVHDEPRLCLANPYYYGPALCTQEERLISTGPYLAPRVAATTTLGNYWVTVECPTSGPCQPSGRACEVDASGTMNRTSESLTYSITYSGYTAFSTAPSMVAYGPSDRCPSPIVITARTSSGDSAYRYLW